MTDEEKKIVRNFISRQCDYIAELQQVADDFKKLVFREVGEKLQAHADAMIIHLHHSLRIRLPLG